MDTKAHYDHHLSNIYVWMCGPFEEKQIAQQTFFERHNIVPNNSKVALDLGAAHGIQTVSLAKLGFDVIAVDFNEQLLGSLKINSKPYNVRTVCSDLLTFLRQSNHQPELIVCMGDTLPHLASMAQVEELISLCAGKLAPNGKLILSFRDLVDERSGTQRFIPVQSDAQRILTCFLEFFPEKVVVHDIIHELEREGWQQRVSSYEKLRLNASLVNMMINQHKFKIAKTEIIQGMIHLVAEKCDEY
jgi:2-polyprenyl-3-methyl-5-hydroxy-6-metoxy-1,4-benzoquinol methylase